MGKLLNHLQPKRKDSTEDWPAFIESTEKTSHCNASSFSFVLNGCLSSCLKSLFSFCLLTFEPQDHLMVEKPPSTCIAWSRHEGELPDQTQVTTSHLPRCCHLLWMQTYPEELDQGAPALWRSPWRPGAALKAGARSLPRSRMLLETSLDQHRRDWGCGETMGTNLRAYYVSGLSITQALHPTKSLLVPWPCSDASLAE